MTTRELLQQALKVQMDMQEGHVELNELLDSINNISAHLAKPEPEPVAWLLKTIPPDGYPFTENPTFADRFNGIPLYTKDQL